MSFQDGIDAYHRGEHYEAHEHWEELWDAEADDRRRDFFQALIQVASAAHKAVNNVAPRGSLRLLDAATSKLAPLDDVYLGIDVAALREGIEQCRAKIDALLEASGECHLDAGDAPTIAQLSDAPLVQGSSRAPAVPPSAHHAWFDRGVATYQSGDYFDAHELWEEMWRDAPPSFDRFFVQGLIQVAAAMHKAFEHNKPAPAARLLGRAIDKLADAPPHYRDIDVNRLVADAKRAQDKLADGEMITSDEVPRIVKRPRLRPAPPKASD